ncbi:exo-alpha-sialidase [Fibrella sp. HMF5335]|uniref:Exo-alpha-sialidase n=1 Tax=Fibrella rubiginis TaxID=2817060 RepID=A0A939GK58_9BACT|nr:sialidase family protein [Fibrella rubiginis]MBO0938295.1 exo-alpha-sialidase [Fibrella rubiginis]
MRLVQGFLFAFVLLTQTGHCRPGKPLVADDTRTVAMPVLTQTKTGQVLLSWTEKDPDGLVSFNTALSADGGKTFSEKRLVYAAKGIGNSRLMKPRILVQPNGTLVAVFVLRTETAPAATTSAMPSPAAPAPAEHNHAGMNHGDMKPTEAPKPAATTGERGGRPSRGPATTQIMVSSSTDNGQTWTAPKAVDSDPTPNLLRGFFDAAVLPNGELAIAYLKDVAGSTKHEERNLRLVVTKNGQFQPERIIDPVACDCCNVGLLVDANGALNVYYRDNNDDIRDMSRMVSTDNGLTFSSPKTIYADNWKINGCPHSGPSAIKMGNSALVAWYSGTTNNTPGLRVVTQQGERLAVIEEPSAKNASLVEVPGAGVLLWDQVRGATETPTSAIAYRTFRGGKSSETKWLADSEQGQNASGLVINNQLVVAYELKRPGKPNALQLGYVSL